MAKAMLNHGTMLARGYKPHTRLVAAQAEAAGYAYPVVCGFRLQGQVYYVAGSCNPASNPPVSPAVWHCSCVEDAVDEATYPTNQALDCEDEDTGANNTIWPVAL